MGFLSDPTGEKASAIKFCKFGTSSWNRQRSQQRSPAKNMPSAQEIRTYLEKNSIQAALTAAVNEAIQARAPNPLDFIGDSLKAKAAAAAAAGGDEGNAEGNPGSDSLEHPVSLDAPASTAASPEPDDFFKVSITPPAPLPLPLPSL